MQEFSQKKKVHEWANGREKESSGDAAVILCEVSTEGVFQIAANGRQEIGGKTKGRNAAVGRITTCVLLLESYHGTFKTLLDRCLSDILLLFCSISKMEARVKPKNTYHSTHFSRHCLSQETSKGFLWSPWFHVERRTRNRPPHQSEPLPSRGMLLWLSACLCANYSLQAE